ncbi:hypothetical protein CLV59_102755 [Chitinophaga dinghuensis]|uniref:GAF domain-containing protein n=1 Tax=Chitinophaga dinghuensis TaxID=1539050 RepID=A0A327W8T5_9BACT|nr:GAF domain-containing protein [Chitinophaga dinghuensis]RAJ86044.1 hypothetical protein CLV59_102755 [Chitinophaga dinghuensis]
MEVLTATQDLLNEEDIIQSNISFAPFLRFLQEKVDREKDGRTMFYQYILDKFEAKPELLQPLPQNVSLDPYRDYLDLLIAAIFPVTVDTKKDIYGISVPFRFAIFYYSEMFRQIFVGDNGQLSTVPHGISLSKVKKDKKVWLYKLILDRHYHFPIGYQNDIIHTIHTPDGIKRQVKVNVDARFVDVRVKGELPPLDYNQFCTRQMPLETLETLLPLDNFALEGFAIWTIEDVTQGEAVNTIKSLVMNMNSTNELESYRTVERMVPAILGIFDVTAHIVPFPKVNNKHVLEEQFTPVDPVLGIGNKKQEQQLFAQMVDFLYAHPEPLIIPQVTEDSISQYPFLKYLVIKKIRSFVLFPIRYKNQVLGVLELAASRPNALSERPLWQLQSIYPLLVLMLNRSINILESRINQVIKEQFTALQPSVEWKFIDAAWKYLLTPEAERKDISNISFEEVYPLFGAVDIRNSSVEQGNAIREDLQEQLQLVDETLTVILKSVKLNLLEELQFKTRDILENLQHNLTAGEDAKINDFITQEVQPVLEHLCNNNEELKPVLEKYYAHVDQKEGHVYHHRREYEESLARVNTAINHYLEKERNYIQESFPCYFEKYRTDGVEYTIYIGQSIAQEKKFDHLYLRNLRLWQLSSMANIARITHRMQSKMKIPLQTTQMILMHSAPITISFRNDERRFDVEGAYNIRYEIIKKRIDKVHVKETGERLTQPGMIAIVYSNVREMEEYKKYISFLQSKNILLPDLEMLDLEELQGVSGLKALRVKVNLEELSSELKA